ncbi:hypothetical protein H4S08_003195 [Coemansia sp. RSA 1365]|nr:hypothetical protein H4S08_003195 [Coemansia sp. RSA 1365]
MSKKHGIVYAEGYDKKAIYDSSINEEDEHTQKKTAETRISATLGNLRADGKHLVKGIQCHGQQIVRQWIEAEQRVERVIKNTVPEGERLAPGIVYVGVAMLAGPIFTRRRNVMVRWLSPWIFGSAAMSWFLPGTTAVVVRNIWGRYGDATSIDRAKERWTDLWNVQKKFQKDLADRVQQLRISLQEGRGFSTTLPTKIVEVIEEPSDAHNAWDITGEAAIPVLEADTAVAEAVPKVLHEVNELEKQKSSEKNKLPLGFKNKVDN